MFLRNLIGACFCVPSETQ